VVHTESSSTSSLAAEYVDTAETVGTDFYYLRVTQADGEMAWSSPIWLTAANQ
jgi:hypothetical protein